MTADLLTLSGVESAQLTATPAAVARRDELLAIARRGTLVTTKEGADRAGTILKDLKAFSRMIEDARQIVKERPLELCRQIDQLATKLTKDVKTEADRISRLLGAWQDEQERLAEEAKQKAFEEEVRIREEAEAKAKEEAERAAKEKAELEAKAARARSPEKAAEWREKAEQREEQSRVDSAAHVAQTEQRIVETRVAAAAIAPVKPDGLATRRDPHFEVTDIVELYEAAPFLVTLQPNNAAIKAALRGLTKDQTLPGVRHWWETKANVR